MFSNDHFAAGPMVAAERVEGAGKDAGDEPWRHPRTDQAEARLRGVCERV